MSVAETVTVGGAEPTIATPVCGTTVMPPPPTRSWFFPTGFGDALAADPAAVFAAERSKTG